MSAKHRAVALAITRMTYGELLELANDIEQMQVSAKEDGWKWEPSKAVGEFGIMAMLHSWAEGEMDRDE